LLLVVGCLLFVSRELEIGNWELEIG